MVKAPSVSGKEPCRALEKDGFTLAKQTGTEYIIKRPTEGAITVVPVHSNKPLKKGTLHSPPTKTGITREKLLFLLSVILKAP